MTMDETGTPVVHPIPDGLLGWTTFVAVMILIGGGLSILTCVGIPQGVLMVIGGIALLGGKTALEGVTSVDAAILPYLQKMRLFMQMQGWIYIMGLLLGGLILIFYFGIIMAWLSMEGF
jgi:hypothetical protein